MDGPGVSLLEQALADGGQVVWKEPNRPTLRLSKKWQMALSNELEGVREVLRRAALFRKQANGQGPLLILALPGAPIVAGGCISCGKPNVDTRCPGCRLAAWIVLGWLGEPK